MFQNIVGQHIGITDKIEHDVFDQFLKSKGFVKKYYETYMVLL